MANLLESHTTTTDYSLMSREELELRARILDAITLDMAAVYHSYQSTHQACMNAIDTLAASDHLNYFSQDRLDGRKPLVVV